MSVDLICWRNFSSKLQIVKNKIKNFGKLPKIYDNIYKLKKAQPEAFIRNYV